MAPLFKPGAKVRTREQQPEGHTRLPRYLARKPATIVRTLGRFPLPDEAAIDPPKARKSELYTVEFDARDVWERADAHGRICADVFEEYLEMQE